MAEARFDALQIVEMGGRDALTWRLFRANAGEFHIGHKHTIDHVTLLPRGALRIDYGDGRPSEHHIAPASIQVAADVPHTLTATVDDTEWLCTFLIPPGGDARALSSET